MSLKVAIVGCGKIADGHVEEIQKMPGRAHVVAVCDRELLMAEQIAMRYGLPAYYDSLEKLLERERPDVVHVTTPPQSHLALTRLAVDAGAHVYCEKPLAPTYAETQALVEHVEKAGKKLGIGYTYYFDPPAQEMRRLVADGTLGDVVHVESWYGYDLGGAFGQALLGDGSHWVHALPGKLFHNNIDHALNKITEFVDDEDPAIHAVAWRRREARTGDARDEMPDELRVIVQGARVSAYVTFTAHVHPVSHFLRVYGTRNIAHADFVGRTVTLEPGATLPSAVGRLVPAFGQAARFLRAGGQNALRFARSDYHFFAGLNHLLAAYYSSILDGGPAPITTRDMLRVARWMERIFDAVKKVEVRA